MLKETCISGFSSIGTKTLCLCVTALTALTACVGPDSPSPNGRDRYAQFEQVFHPSRYVVLEGLAREDLGGLAVDSRGAVYALDQKSGRVRQYDSLGRLERTLGPQGEPDGRFKLALALAVDAEDRLYVLDTALSRVSVLNSSGEFSRSFFFSGRGIVGVNLAVAPGSGEIYVGTNKPVDKAGGSDELIYRFDAQGEFIESLYPADERVDELNLSVIGGASFVADRGGKLYAVQRIRAGFDQISPDGQSVRLGGIPDFYAPPFEFPDPLPDRARVTSLLAEFTQTTDVLLVSEDLVLVVYRTHAPSRYVTEVFDTTGRRLAPPVRSEARPVSAVGTKREVAFLEPDTTGSEVKLRYHHLTIPGEGM